MPKLFDEGERAALVAMAVTDLLSEGGASTVSLRAVASRTGLSLSSLRHYLETRQRLMSVSCHLSGMAHLERFREHMRGRGTAGLVAQDGQEVLDDRGWLAWVELGRFDPHLNRHVADVEEREWHILRLALGRWLGRTPERVEVNLVVATVRGLRAGRCRLEEPLPHAEAVAALDLLVNGLLVRDPARERPCSELGRSRLGSAAQCVDHPGRVVG